MIDLVLIGAASSRAFRAVERLLGLGQLLGRLGHDLLVRTPAATARSGRRADSVDRPAQAASSAAVPITRAPAQAVRRRFRQILATRSPPWLASVQETPASRAISSRSVSMLARSSAAFC